jgi:hypothetical protein
MNGSRAEDGATPFKEWAIRNAEAADVVPICEFGEAHIRRITRP